MALSMVPVTAMAEEIADVPEAQEESEDEPKEVVEEIYVSKTGSDESGDGSKENPYATLAKAVAAAPDDATVKVMDDLLMYQVARVTDKHLTITSADTNKPAVLTRINPERSRPNAKEGVKGFAPTQDNARSTYNPAMIEVVTWNEEEGTGDVVSSVILENIILDDAGYYEGTKFEGPDTSGKGGNDNKVQDAIIGAYGISNIEDGEDHSRYVEVILGQGTVLKNFGGMSAVRCTACASVTMENGSKICDEDYTARKSGNAAVWCQSAELVMEEGSVVDNIYKANGVQMQYNGAYTIGGTISNVNGQHGLLVHDPSPDLGRDSYAGVITETGMITGCTNCYYGAVYIQSGTLDFYGKITDNSGTGRGAGLTLNNNYGYVEATMYSGAEISGNSVDRTGGGVCIAEGLFTMKGGTIKGNTAKIGAGVYIHESDVAKFVMEGGVIEDNAATEFGGGIAIDGPRSSCNLVKGTIENNTAEKGGNDLALLDLGYGRLASPYGYMEIFEKMKIEDPEIYTVVDGKYIIADDVCEPFKLGNASGDTIKVLAAVSNNKGWSAPLQTLWYEDAEDVTHFLLSTPKDGNKNLPYYVIAAETTETGLSVGDGYITIYSVPVVDSKDVEIEDVELSGEKYLNVTFDSAKVYEVPYTATYTMSENLANILNQGATLSDFVFTVELDNRMFAKAGVECTATGLTMGEVKAENGIVKVPCTLTGSVEAASLTVSGIGILSAENFKSGESLFSEANVVAEVSGIEYDINIPSNVAETKMVAAKKFEVTFDANDGVWDNGDEERVVEVVEGDTVDKPETPSRSGYKFLYWKYGGEEWDFTNEIDKNMTIKAVWEKKSDGGGNHKPPVVEDEKEDDNKGGSNEQPEMVLGDVLNGGDHFAYVAGYPDGMVRPQQNITRAETAAIFYRLLNADVREVNTTIEHNFSDVPAGEWYEVHVATLSAMGILSGRDNGTFDPNAPITRAEFAAICARFDKGEVEVNQTFKDIAEHWAKDEIEHAAARGWVSGYPDGSYLPEQKITRAEAMVIINRALCRVPETVDDLLPGMKTWVDNQPGDWYYLPVQEATNGHTFEYKDATYERWIELTDVFENNN